VYTGRLSLGEAIAAPLRVGAGTAEIWPTVVCDELGGALGLAWSTRESVERAVAMRRGVYWSRSRDALWVKGEISGNLQELVRVDLDCDRDALRFMVRQRGTGFCHLPRKSCWPDVFDLGDLERVIGARRERPAAQSGTVRLLSDGALLGAKLREEAAELAAARTAAEAVHETADLLYMALVALARSGGSLADVVAELERRNLVLTRRPMAAK